jgi:hypothetical protein
MSWDLETDTIEAGQWFKGRIYERRCDLTPEGDLLVYFAASFRKPFYSWTAISRPPYLTALALWPKGDCWGGGGLFDKHRNLRLNHRPKTKETLPGADRMRLADGFNLPRALKVMPLGEQSGRGEDDPINSTRLARDGWVVVSPGAWADGRSRYSWVSDPPLTRQKPIGCLPPAPLVLRTHLHAIDERQGRWYVMSADVANRENRVLNDLGRIDWADLDHNGDVVFAKDGCLLRLPISASHGMDEPLGPRMVADLTGMTFEPVEAPEWVHHWG